MDLNDTLDPNQTHDIMDSEIGYKYVPIESWRPFDYQVPALEAFDKWELTDETYTDPRTNITHKKYRHIGCKRMAFEWHRQSGKDTIMQIMLFRTMMFIPGGYLYYMFPDMAQFRAVMLEDPTRPWDLVPEGFMTYHETKTTFTCFNGARIKCVAADKLKGGGGRGGRVGVKLDGAIISEMQNCRGDPIGYIEPGLRWKKGFLGFNFTPRGHDQATGQVDLFTKEYQKGNPRYYGATITNKDTRLISEEEMKEKFIEASSRFGPDIAEALLKQEYYCSREAGDAFAYFREEMKTATKHQTYDLTAMGYPNFDLPVFSGWDIAAGKGGDYVVCVPFQVMPDEEFGDIVIYVLGYYASRMKNTKHVVEHYLYPEFYEKGYKKGYAALPHDMEKGGATVVDDMVDEFQKDFNIPVFPTFLGGSSGDKAKRRTMIRKLLPNCIFDKSCDISVEGTTHSLMNALRHYRGEWNDQKQDMYEFKDWTTDFVDAFGTGLQAINITFKGKRDFQTKSIKEQLEEMYTDPTTGERMITTPIIDPDDDPLSQYNHRRSRRR